MPEAPQPAPIDQTDIDDEDPGRTQVPPNTGPLAEIQAAAKEELTAEQQAVASFGTPFIDSFSWNPPQPGASTPPRTQEAVPPIPAQPTPEPPKPADPPKADPTPEPDKPTELQVVEARESDRVEPMIEVTDLTIKRSDLPQVGELGEATVVAFECPRGHYNPPYGTLCRVCRAPIDPHQKVREIARPSLGILRLWGGGTVTLDRGVIFGRNPHLIPDALGSEPNLIKIKDPKRDVSSQHAEVRLEDWYVTVTDLNSTNGTAIILPNRAPITLKPNDPMAIESGTRVILASAFDFVFEVV